MTALLSALLFSAASAALALDDSNVPLSRLNRGHHQPSITAIQVADKAAQSEVDTVPERTSDLENAFWICDYAQTEGVIGLEHEAFCSTITEEFRRVKFDGEFEKLLAWWQENRLTRHQELDQAFAAAVEIERNTSSGI